LFTYTRELEKKMLHDVSVYYKQPYDDDPSMIEQHGTKKARAETLLFSPSALNTLVMKLQKHAPSVSESLFLDNARNDMTQHLHEIWEVADGTLLPSSPFSSESSLTCTSSPKEPLIDSSNSSSSSSSNDDNHTLSDTMTTMTDFCMSPTIEEEQLFMTKRLSPPLSIPLLLDQLDAQIDPTMKSILRFKYCPNDGRPFQAYEPYCTLCRSEHDALHFLKSRTNQPQLPWRSLLYVKQPYPDNHVDATFLMQMRKNMDLRTYDYWVLVQESGIISQQYTSILIFVALFIYTYHGHISDTSLLQFCGCLTTLGYTLWDRMHRCQEKKTIIIPHHPLSHSQQHRTATMKAAALIVACVLTAAPTLHTLTESTSSVTIWALTVCLLIANLLFHDYSSSDTMTIKYPSSLSLSAAIFASVLLASRLSTRLHVFALITLALEWFALFPILRRFLRRVSMAYFVYLTLLLFATTVILYSRISVAVVVVYTSSMAFITFVCPFWLIWIQRYKNQIHGPWDVAQPSLRSLSSTHD
jgi:phosphatidylinositol glycan class C protein